MKYIIGSYVTAPSLTKIDEKSEKQYYNSLIKIPQIRGLEIPFWGENIHPFGNDYMLPYLNPNWENTMTCVPCSTLPSLQNTTIGLASNNEDSRLYSLKLHRNAFETFNLINQHFSKNIFLAIQIASAPINKENQSSLKSFRKSLEEIISWDWGESKILIEHCDTYKKNSNFDKGFLNLNDEINIAKSINEYDIGFILNTARSLIEGEDISSLISHIDILSKEGMLKGLMFSGTSRKNNLYGPWKDLHMPFGDFKPSKYPEYESELNESTLNNIFSKIVPDELMFMGFKLMVLPHETAAIEKRVGVNQDAANILDIYINKK